MVLALAASRHPKHRGRPRLGLQRAGRGAGGEAAAAGEGEGKPAKAAKTSQSVFFWEICCDFKVLFGFFPGKSNDHLS